MSAARRWAFRHPNGRGTTVPFHASRDVSASPAEDRDGHRSHGRTAFGRAYVAAEQADEADEARGGTMGRGLRSLSAALGRNEQQQALEDDSGKATVAT